MAHSRPTPSQRSAHIFLRKEPHELFMNVASKRLHAEILSEQILSEQKTTSEPTRKIERIRIR